MEYINVAEMAPVKECLIIVGDLAFYCDAYIIMPDGYLLGSKDPKDPSLVIMTKVDGNGAIITEYNSGTTYEEFIELRDNMVKAMQEQAHDIACNCGDEECEIDDMEGVEDPEFKTEMTEQDTMAYV